MSTASARERELRAKYLDWCSARLADRFLALSPDEIYELAERASHGRPPAPPVASGAAPGLAAPGVNSERDHAAQTAWLEPENFRVLVARVAEVLADTLPSFEDWTAEYEQAPARFDDELLGFWKENLQKNGQ
jgi:hypothetical protein